MNRRKSLECCCGKKICATVILTLDCTLYSSWELSSKKLYWTPCPKGSDLIPLDATRAPMFSKVLVLTLMISSDCKLPERVSRASEGAQLRCGSKNLLLSQLAWFQGSL